MPNITISVPTEAVPAIQETFGGATAAETVANVKNFLKRSLIQEVRRTQEHNVAEVAKAGVVSIPVT